MQHIIERKRLERNYGNKVVKSTKILTKIFCGSYQWTIDLIVEIKDLKNLQKIIFNHSRKKKSDGDGKNIVCSRTRFLCSNLKLAHTFTDCDLTLTGLTR